MRFLVLILLSAAFGAPATKQVEVKAGTSWVDTGIDLKAGDVLKSSATGAVVFPGAAEIPPAGVARGWRDLARTYPLNDANRGALLGRIGSAGIARPFPLGASKEYRAPVAGRLFLGLNLSAGELGSGSFTVSLSWSAGPAPAKQTTNLPAVTNKHLNQIPARVSDAAGTPGDRVNFLILGSEDQVKQALAEAGWVIVDKNAKSSVLAGILATINRQAYVTMPMSELILFDRTQDYGYAHADPLSVVAQRHHFRLWRAPFEVGGATLWAGAGTHDIGFDRDQRNNKVTHKIDPDTDKEREFISGSLEQTGRVAKTEFLTPEEPLTKAKTAHGEEFFSDGRVVVIYLQPE
jgi:hypothetical protein